MHAHRSIRRSVSSAISRALVVCLSAVTLLGTPATALTQTTISLNTNLTPTPLTFGLSGIAWQLTPTTTTTVGGIRTWFADVPEAVNKDVTFQIRDGGNVNGAALRSVTFNSAIARGTLGGADFSAITLSGGSSYWLVFLGVGGVGRNVQETPPDGATRLPVSLLFNNAPSFAPTTLTTAPIVQLTAVPEPSTNAMLGVGLGILVWYSTRRQRVLRTQG